MWDERIAGAFYLQVRVSRNLLNKLSLGLIIYLPFVKKLCLFHSQNGPVFEGFKCSWGIYYTCRTKLPTVWTIHFSEKLTPFFFPDIDEFEV